VTETTASTDSRMHSAIELVNVHKDYTIESARVEALRGVSVKIPEGSIVGVTGKSGAGKSTLLHIIGTLDRPSTGQVFINGSDISKMNDFTLSRFRNRCIGFIFQMNNLLPEFTALENVMMPSIIAGLAAPSVRARATELLSSVGLGKRLSHKPGELSGGEQQRVAIARAMVMNPPLIVADEPTGNLDRKTSLIIQDLLLDLVRSNQMTMLLVTHDMELANRLPSHIVMEDGLVTMDGVVH
jgi:lipoprotein-releasing system ATP-binding protein